MWCRTLIFIGKLTWHRPWCVLSWNPEQFILVLLFLRLTLYSVGFGIFPVCWKVAVRVCVCRWNQLDLAIVLLSVMGITLEEIEINASLPINPTIIRIMRVLRIARGIPQPTEAHVLNLPMVFSYASNFILHYFFYYFIFLYMCLSLTRFLIYHFSREN